MLRQTPNAKRLTILFVLENYLPHIGGVEVVFKTLAEALSKLNHDVSVVTHRIKGTKTFEVINGVKIYRINCLYSRYLFTFLAVFKALRLAKRADIIHTTTFNGAPPAWLVSKLLRKKCMITIHEVWINHWKEYTNFSLFKRLLHEFLERLIYLLPFDKYIAVSKSTQSQLNNINIPSEVVYNGVDYDHFNPKKYKIKKNKTFTCLITGRAGPSKGIEHAVKAISKVPNAKLLLILSDNKQYQKANENLKQLAKQLTIQDKVIFHLPVKREELPKYIKAADCVIVPSLAEGFGFTAAEACAMGTPVIASNTTSLLEVVSNKYILVKPRDSDEIAKAIIKVKDKNYKTSKLKKFVLESNINNYLKIYNKLLTCN